MQGGSDLYLVCVPVLLCFGIIYHTIDITFRCTTFHLYIYIYLGVFNFSFEDRRLKNKRRRVQKYKYAINCIASSFADRSMGKERIRPPARDDFAVRRNHGPRLMCIGPRARRILPLQCFTTRYRPRSRMDDPATGYTPFRVPVKNLIGTE